MENREGFPRDGRTTKQPSETSRTTVTVLDCRVSSSARGRSEILTSVKPPEKQLQMLQRNSTALSRCCYSFAASALYTRNATEVTSYSNMSDGYPSDWNNRRKKVYKKDNYTCQNCGSVGGPKGNTELHAHHVVPKSSGGTHKISNLTTLCKDCHRAVHGDIEAPSASNKINESSTYGSYAEMYAELRMMFVPISELRKDYTDGNYQFDDRPLVELIIAIDIYRSSLVNIIDFASSPEPIPEELHNRYMIADEVVEHILHSRSNRAPPTIELMRAARPSMRPSAGFDVGDETGAENSYDSNLWEIVQNEKEHYDTPYDEYSRFWYQTEEFVDSIYEFHQVTQKYILVDDGGYVTLSSKKQDRWELEEAAERLLSVVDNWGESAEHLAEEGMREAQSSDDCFIATAAMGTPDAYAVQDLRQFRDEFLKKYKIGRFFIGTYYSLSPPIADWIAESPLRRRLVRALIVIPAAKAVSFLIE